MALTLTTPIPTIPQTPLLLCKKPIRTGAMSTYPYSEELEHLLTFVSPFGDTVCGAVKHPTSKCLEVPREAFPYANAPEDYRVSYPVAAIKCTFIPRPGQMELCRQSIDFLKAGRSHIFQAETGSGKTLMGSYIASQIGQPTLIVVTKQDLMDQWRSAFQILKIDPSLVGHIQGDTCNWKGKKFVLGMVQSLMQPDRYDPEMYKYFGMLMLDEVHQMAADCFIRVCQTIPAKYRLGLSATPKRKDGKTKLLSWHIGPTLVTGTIPVMKPKVIIRQTGWKIPITRQHTKEGIVYEKLPHSPGRMMTVFGAMATNKLRNGEIVNFVVQAFKADRRCLVLADTLEHLENIFQALCTAGVAGNDIGYYVGGKKKLELAAAKVKRIVLGTFKMCSTGTDVPIWDSLVLATPHSDVKQSVGRVLRQNDGKKQPVILDLVDDEQILIAFGQSRLKQYWGLNADIVRL